MRIDRLLRGMLVFVLAGWLGSPSGWTAEEKEKPKEKPPAIKEPAIKEKPLPVREEDKEPERFIPGRKLPPPDREWSEWREGPFPRGPERREEADRPHRKEKEKERVGFPDRPERGEREGPPLPKRKPEWGPEGGPGGPRMPEHPDRPPVGPPEGPPREVPGFPGVRPDWERLQRTDPEMFRVLRADAELEEQTHRLAMEFRRASEKDKEQIRKELEAVVAKHFEVRQERRLLEVRRLEEELRRLRENIERRQIHREQIIQNRLRELLGTDDILRF